MLEQIVLPEDLSTLSDDELGALIDEVTERATALHEADDALLAELGDQAVPLIENALACDEAVTAERTRRDEAQAEQDQILADTRARLAARLEDEPEDEGDPEATPEDEPAAEVDPPADDPEADAEPAADADPVPTPELEPVTAASRGRRRGSYRRTAAQDPVPAAAAGDTRELIALAGIPGEFEAGATITREQASRLVSQRWNRSHGGEYAQDMPLVRVKVNTPDDRTLMEGDDSGNWNKIQAVVGPEALTAAGGICAPPEPYYELQLLSTDETPVVDSLPRFGAERGGLRWMTPPTLASITTAVGVKTAANDALGGTNATKTSQVLPCPAQQTVTIDAIYHQVTIGNFAQRTWPELVDNFMALTSAAHARVRETKMLDAIKNGSTAVTGAQYNGAINTLIPELNVLTDALRSRHRMATGARFRAWFPRWLLGLLITDLQRGQFDRFSRDRAGVEAIIRDAGVEPTWYFDSETGGGQVFGTQGAGAAQIYPSTMKWYLAPEGSWLRLDGGELDIGIVRDSVLNATNDFSSFGEVFETIAFIGIESLAITTSICANGVVSAPAAPSGC